MPIRSYTRLGPLDNNTYLIVGEVTKEVALVDPSFDSQKILEDIAENGYSLRYILNTHAHFDHIIGNAFFAEKTGAPIALHRDDLELLRALPEQGKLYNFEATPSPEPTIFLEEGQSLILGDTKIEVLFTPGHAPGHVTFVVGETALVGDVLFANSIGRTDLPGGSLETLLHSIRTRLLTLPDTTQVLPGHGRPTSIGRERRSNPYLEGLEEGA